MQRRTFLEFGFAVGMLGVAGTLRSVKAAATFSGRSPLPDQSAGLSGLVEFILQQPEGWNQDLYRRLLGHANEFKEGDQILGIAAIDDVARSHARTLLANTTLEQIHQHPPFTDELSALILDSTGLRPTTQQGRTNTHVSGMNLGQLKAFLLGRSEGEIRLLCGSLSSDVIACVVRLMSNSELIRVGAKVFNPLPGTNIGARGYLGARVQPNSPTDHPEDIRWQVLNAFAYGVGDVLLGTNPVSSDPETVAGVEQTLQDLLVTFGIADAMPHCVLAHIDVQSEVERRYPGSTELWFQSIAGNDRANATFDISVEKMVRYATGRTGRYALYFETGQGADFTNGHGHGTDMVFHESRKYGFIRKLTAVVRESLRASGKSHEPWVHVNDVAGFIGPEVFRSREQLVRCCLEDIVMGKLHGLTIGLDICSTLHMDVSLDDLDWCIDQVMPACPAYLMALPTKIDPMLGYLTTGYQDHVRIREHFGLKVNDRMWQFFRQLGVIGDNDQPTEHFGDPVYVYLQYRIRKGDMRPRTIILEEGRDQIAAVRSRGLFIAEGFGDRPSQMKPELRQQTQTIYEDARACIWRELTDAFAESVPAVVRLETNSKDREDYILHPVSGEYLSASSLAIVDRLRRTHDQQFGVQIVVSDGLNALAVMDDGHLQPLLTALRNGLQVAGHRVAVENLLVTSGRVRAGYRIGERLFGGLPGQRTIVHIIGERPGSGHHTLSIYLTTADGATWAKADSVDHNITRVVSGIAVTALAPPDAAAQAVRILLQNGQV